MLKISYQKRQKYFVYQGYTPELIAILKKLQRKALILGYFEKNDLELQVFLRYDLQSLPAINELFLFPKCRYVSKETLKRILNDYPLSFSLIQTHHGLLDLDECLAKNCGGELLVNIK